MSKKVSPDVQASRKTRRDYRRALERAATNETKQLIQIQTNKIKLWRKRFFIMVGVAALLLILLITTVGYHYYG